ncbi:MAG TPA: DNA recombination protein RmuC [Caulobacteraceae bacterium]
MNSAPLLDILLLALAVGAVVWAMAERGRAQRALVELAHSKVGEEAIKAQAAMSANQVTDELIKRATETFKPMGETLEKFEARVAAMERTRAEEAGGLKSQIEALLAASTATQAEARRLSTALKSGAGVQGRWGEQMLRNVLELAGMRAGTDFTEQVHVDAGGGAQRPDVTVRLPGGGLFVIDAKCSTTAYLEAQDAPDEPVREAAYMRHAASVRAHMMALANKAYWSQFETSPDFVVMFIPGDAFLSAAQERLPDLHTQAMERRVILATPSSLFALCKAVSYGWRVEAQARNAKEIADLGRELYKRLSVMAGHITKLGKSLGDAVGKYNDFVSSLETRVLVQARRFEELHADTPASPIPNLTRLDAPHRLDAEPDILTLEEAAHTSAP